MTPFRRRRAGQSHPPPQPRTEVARQRKPPPPADTGGEDARKAAERALHESRARRQREIPLRRWFRMEFEENHWQRDVDAIWGGH